MFLTNAPGDTPWRPFEDDDDHRWIEHGGIKATKQPWDLGHPPQKQDRAVRVHGIGTWRMCAWATADRRPCESEGLGDEPVGWQRGRRQRREPTRDRRMGGAEGAYGIVQLAAYALFGGARAMVCSRTIGSPLRRERDVGRSEKSARKEPC